MPIVALVFPAGQIVPHPETISLLFFQDDQHGFVGSYHRLFFKGRSLIRIAFRMFRTRNVAVAETFEQPADAAYVITYAELLFYNPLDISGMKYTYFILR